MQNYIHCAQNNFLNNNDVPFFIILPILKIRVLLLFKIRPIPNSNSTDDAVRFQNCIFSLPRLFLQNPAIFSLNQPLH